MVAFLMSLQAGFTKFPSYLCLWDSRDIATHYHSWDSQQADRVQSREEQRQMRATTEPRKILFPPLYLKFGLMKQFVIAPDKESAAAKYLKDLFANLSIATVKASVLVG